MKLAVEESDFVFCDVQDILRYLRKRNAAAALRFIQAFKFTVEQLSEMPHLGRTRPDLGFAAGTGKVNVLWWAIVRRAMA